MDSQQLKIRRILIDFCLQALIHLTDPDCDVETVMAQSVATFELVAAEMGIDTSQVPQGVN